MSPRMKVINETLPEFYGAGSLSVHEHIERANTDFFMKGSPDFNDLFALNARLIMLLDAFRDYQVTSSITKSGERFQVVK